MLWEPHSRATLVSKARSHAHYRKSANVSPKEEEGKWEDERSVNLWLESKYLSPVGADLNRLSMQYSLRTRGESGSDALAIFKERRKVCR